jgi:Ca2+-binding RTX toxin-like protein
MRARQVHRSSLAAASTATALLVFGLAAPAHAADIASCSFGNDSILVDVSSTEQDLTVSNLGGFVSVQDTTGTWSCATPTSQAGQIFLQLVGTTSHRWLVDVSTPFSSAVTGNLARVVLPNQPSEPVIVAAAGSVGQQWTYLGTMNGPNNEFTLDGGATSDLSIKPGTGLLTLHTESGNDTIDLFNGGLSPYPEYAGSVISSGDGNDAVKGGMTSDDIDSGWGDDVVQGGAGTDTIHDGAGQDTFYGTFPGNNNDWDVDHIFLSTDYLPDQVNPGSADQFDWVTFESFGDPIDASVDGVANDGAPGEGDDINGVVQVTTGFGPDRIDTAHLWTIDSGEGDDVLTAHLDPTSPITQWFAGTGDDTIDFSSNETQVNGNVQISGASFELDGYEVHSHGVEAVIGSPQADTFQLVCACTVRPGLGNDAVQLIGDGARFLADDAPDGADVVTTTEDAASTVDYNFRTSAVSLTSDGDANDGAPGEGDNIGSAATTLVGGLGADTIVGSAVDNTILGGPGANVLTGRGGDDRIEGGNGKDTLTGGSGNDRLLGHGAADKLMGGEGDDVLTADDPFDNITAGADTLDGGNGDDDEFGYWGNDTVLEGAAANGGDLIVGGAGTDLASYALRAAALKLTLNGLYDDGAAGEGDRLGSDVENLTGGKGADLIVGNALANLLTGGLGKDTLKGLAGNDVFQTLDKLVDVLDGGTGTDKAHRDTTDKVTSVEQKF